MSLSKIFARSLAPQVVQRDLQKNVRAHAQPNVVELARTECVQHVLDMRRALAAAKATFKFAKWNAHGGGSSVWTIGGALHAFQIL